ASGERSGPLRELRNNLDSEIAEHFLDYCASEPLLTRSPWLTSLLDNGIKRGDVTISLNYDCLLEGALDCREKWSPLGGYGLPRDSPLFTPNEYPRSPVTVLKIHGSASFIIAPI